MDLLKTSRLTITNNNLIFNESMIANTITISDIESMLRNERYQSYYPKERNDLIEDDKNHGIPMMNEVFYRMFIMFKKVPWKAYLTEYKRLYCITLPDDRMKINSLEPRYDYTFTEREIDGKLLRGYMSFCKELFLMYSLKEMGYWTIYDFGNDKNGIDIVVQNKQKDNWYGIRVYSNTEKAKEYAEIKKETRSKLEKFNGTVIVARANMGQYTLGDTYAFTEMQIKNLCEYMDKSLKQNTMII